MWSQFGTLVHGRVHEFVTPSWCISCMHHVSAALALMQQPDFAFLPAAANQVGMKLVACNACKHLQRVTFLPVWHWHMTSGKSQARARLRMDVVDMVLATDMKQV